MYLRKQGRIYGDIDVKKYFSCKYFFKPWGPRRLQNANQSISDERHRTGLVIGTFDIGLKWTKYDIVLNIGSKFLSISEE